MPVIVGAPRSGTTLLRFMLDAHPEVAIPPETGFLPLGASFHTGADQLRTDFFETLTTFPPEAPAWDDFGISREQFWALLLNIAPFSVADGYRAFYRAYAERFGKPRWGDKTPMHCLHLAAIEAVLPEAHFIHIIRDGRDVALSLRQTWFSPGNEIETLAAHWSLCVRTARAQGGACRNYLEVHFEELVRDSSTVLQRICRFLDLDYSAEMLNYYHHVPDRLAEHLDRVRRDGTLAVSQARRWQQQALTVQPPQGSRIQAWRKAMTSDERVRFESVSSPLLLELGYSDVLAADSGGP